MEETENREMRITNTFQAPIKLIWEVWMLPNIL